VPPKISGTAARAPLRRGGGFFSGLFSEIIEGEASFPSFAAEISRRVLPVNARFGRAGITFNRNGGAPE
jgi:hypothetical protein